MVLVLRDICLKAAAFEQFKIIGYRAELLSAAKSSLNTAWNERPIPRSMIDNLRQARTTVLTNSHCMIEDSMDHTLDCCNTDISLVF